MPEKRASVNKTEELQKKIIENLVELQKVHSNLAEKFDKLALQISSLLSLFEKAAHSFAQQPAEEGAEKDKEFLDKIDRLLDQNKTLAKGLTLLEEKMRERVYGPSQPTRAPEEMRKVPSTRPLPRI